MKKSLSIYWIQRKRELAKNIIYGGACGGIVFEFTNLASSVSQKAWISVAIFFALSLFSSIIDFILFLRSGHQKLQNEINTLYEVLKGTLKIENELVTESALNRIKKEIKIIQDFNENGLSLESLQNYEYVRRIYSRILDEIMKREDHYITLSNIDFWTMNPKSELDEFFRDNRKARKLGKYIHRIIVIDGQKYFSNSTLSNEENIKKKRLKAVYEKINYEVGKDKSNYFDSFKFLSYLTNTEQKKELDNFLPSVIVLKSNLRDVMLATVENLEDIENKNSVITIRHFKFKRISKQKDNRFSIIDALADMEKELAEKQTTGTTNAENELYATILQYLMVFGELRHLYNTQGDGELHHLVKNRNNKTAIKDVPMMLADWT